jgi:NAD(P)-dependent dehydrogenase (short-subunit alcohol dehydrogenase family)
MTPRPGHQQVGRRRHGAGDAAQLRLPYEEDLRSTAVYLTSDASNYLTGDITVVDGGWLSW